MRPIIEASDLEQHLDDPHWRIFDVRYGKNAKALYEKSHISGAIFVDLDTQLSKVKDPSLGGRHPLPSVKRFTKQLSHWGIMPSDTIVVYDADSGAMAASRMWWMMRAIGHTKVYVLNGGLKAAQLAGIPVDDMIPQVSPTTYSTTANSWQWPVADFTTMKLNMHAQKHTVLDVRSAERYAGKVEPIDPIAGHIPHAQNIPLSENTTGEGKFKSPGALAKMYAPLFADAPPIFHCGSGVTACQSILATQVAGLPLPMLYVGSWSEWSRSSEDKITQDEQ